MFAEKPSYESDASSLTISASDKIPAHRNSIGESASTDQLEAPGPVSEDAQVRCIHIWRHRLIVNITWAGIIEPEDANFSSVNLGLDFSSSKY